MSQVDRTPEELALHRAIAADPTAETPRLVYADWLDDAGDGPHAAHVRAHAAMHRRYSHVGGGGLAPADVAQLHAIEIASGSSAPLAHPGDNRMRGDAFPRLYGVRRERSRSTGTNGQQNASAVARDPATGAAYIVQRMTGPHGDANVVSWFPTGLRGDRGAAASPHTAVYTGSGLEAWLAQQPAHTAAALRTALADLGYAGPPAATEPTRLARADKRYCPECRAPIFRVHESGTATCARGHQYPHAKTLGPRPVRNAATKAPKGGAIVNNQYQPGGQFLPKAFMRIRDAVRRVWRLARPKRPPSATTLPAAPMNMIPIVRDAGHDLSDRPLGRAEVAHIETTYDIPHAARLSHLPGLFDADGRFKVGKTPPARLYPFFEAIGKSRLADHDLHHLLKNPSLTDQHKTAYLVAHLAGEGLGFRSAVKARHGDDAGEWYGSDMHLFDRGWHHLLNTPTTDNPHPNPDDHLRLGKIDPKTGKVKGVQPGMILARLLLAITSPGTNPEVNTGAALRMMRAGSSRAGGLSPYRTIPTHNLDALRDWKEMATRVHGIEKAGRIESPGRDKTDDLSNVAAWYKEIVLPHHGKETDLRGASGPGYKSKPVGMIVLPDHPLHGKWVYAEKGVVKGGKKKEYIRNNELVEGQPLHKYVNRRSNLRNAIRLVDLPLVDGQGRLLPKGWTATQSVEDGVHRLHRLFDHFDGDAAKVAKFLVTDHPQERIQEITRDAKIDRGTIPVGEHLPGSFAFGPKVGAFFQNLLGNYDQHASRGKFLTTDLWWQRTWNRAINLYRKAKSGFQEDPRGPVERQEMARAAAEATERGGFASVAQLQATLWYYEQQLWRWFGANAPSRSFKSGINKELQRAGHDPLDLRDGRPTFVRATDGA